MHNPVPEGAVVVGVDASESSIYALRWAATQAALTAAPLHVLTCWRVLESYSLLEADISNEVFESDAHQLLTESLSKVDLSSVQLTSSVERGSPAQVLIDASRAASLLVVGSRGHGGFAGMLLGSVSQHCVSHALCPVVVVRHQT